MKCFKCGEEMRFKIRNTYFDVEHEELRAYEVYECRFCRFELVRELGRVSPYIIFNQLIKSLPIFYYINRKYARHRKL